jgi:2-oxoglutarate/2-oxoacid ferredoxin oxidoreductase subunit alpha
MLRAEYLVEAIGINKISGQPFKVAEIEAAIVSALEHVNRENQS